MIHWSPLQGSGTNTFLQIFGPVAFIEQHKNDKNDNLCKIHVGLSIASALIVFFLLDKGHCSENLQKSFCFYCVTLCFVYFSMHYIYLYASKE